MLHDWERRMREATMPSSGAPGGVQMCLHQLQVFCHQPCQTNCSTLNECLIPVNSMITMPLGPASRMIAIWLWQASLTGVHQHNYPALQVGHWMHCCKATMHQHMPCMRRQIQARPLLRPHSMSYTSEAASVDQQCMLLDSPCECMQLLTEYSIACYAYNVLRATHIMCCISCASSICSSHTSTPPHSACTG